MLVATLGLLLFSLPLFSQGTFGRIMGTVTDQSGGVISGATVTIIDTERGVSKTLVTNESGEYNAPTLLPGSYTVRVEARGFKTIDRENIVLEVGKEIRVDATLLPGAQSQTVTVTEAVPLVETTNATLGGTINNADLIDMPLNGRNYQNLVSLRPGVAIQPGGGPWTQSSNEVRPDENVWMVDGVINTNMYDARPIANMPSFISDGATILPVDAIQEFNLEENPKAEYGWKPGAVVNVGVRSGTNTLHGTTYGFYRSAAWDARNLFNPDVTSAPNKCAAAPVGNPALCAKSPTQLKQFGGVLGGPIKKDKLFFFAGYEGLRSLIGNAIVTAGIPETISTGSPKNSMVDAINAVHAAGLTPSLVSLNLACPNAVGQTLPLPTTFACIPPSFSFPVNNSNSTAFTAPFPNTNSTNNGVAKIDYRINSKHSLNGMVFIGAYAGDGMDHPWVNKIFNDQNPIRTNTVGADWVFAASSRLVNDARFGYDFVRFSFLTDDGAKLADGKGYPINTGVTQFPGLPNINLSGFEKLGAWHNRPQHWGNDYFDYQDNISYLMGKHTFRFGGEFATINVTNAIPDTGRGRIDFQGKKNNAVLTDCKGKSCPLEDFFAGSPSRGFLLSGSAEREETWKSSAAFFQDDWRVTPRLTLNLGLRYSYESPIHEVNGLWASFDRTKGLIQQPRGGTLWNPDRKDFSPRAGFAWDVTGRGTTVVRGGFNIIYSTITAVTFLNQNGFQNSTALSLAAIPTAGQIQVGGCAGPPNTCKTGSGSITLQSASVPGSALKWNGVVFGSGATAACGDSVGTDVGPCNIMAVDPNLTTPYITTWSLGVQHSFGSNLSLEVGYVGNHGSRLTGFRDINQGDPAKGGAQPFGKTFPYLNFINQASNDGRSNYNSLQATLTKRISHGLSFIAGYTYAHGLDTASLNRTVYLPQDSRNPGAEYASGDFDIRHRFTFTTTYNVPGIKGFAQMLEGWKLNAIVNIQTPQPWVISDTGNDFVGNGDSSDRWDIFGSPDAFRSGPNSFIFCTGPGPQGCQQTSGVSGDTTFFSGATMWAQCTAHAAGTTGVNGTSNLAADGCFVSGNSVITPPAQGTFGNMGRNIFRDSGFKNVDFSVFKMFTLKERYSAQFRVEVFNLFNHPIAANPYGSANGYGVGNDPSLTGKGGGFGCGCATADVAAGSPQIGSGGARGIQLGLKLQF
ncbi:MAG: TonB-dependent receptor [Candidatus Acidiferrales bacterium]